ncbi:UNVERIFIED_CONTAM: hypothetical protein RMT77_006614 [Armadillidium vulgare]
MLRNPIFMRNIFSSNLQKLRCSCLKRNGYRFLLTQQSDSQALQNISEASTKKLNQIENVQPTLTEEEVYRTSLSHLDFFSVADMFTVEDLFNANVHLGHKEGTLCNHMRPYIFGSRLGHLIIDLDQTATMLRDSLNFTAHIAFRGGIILFMSRGIQHQVLIEKTAEECKEYSHTKPWDTGIFTNSIRAFGCVTRLPDLVIFLNTMYDVTSQHGAVKDAAKMLIATTGIVDTNCDPRLITYPVPGNDDTDSAVKLYCRLYKEAILRGKRKRKELID